MIKIKSVKQFKGYCGPASFKMILDYYGVNYSQEKLAKLTKTTPNEGCAEEDIVRVAKKLGFKAYIKQNSSIKEIKKLISKGIPVIVDWFSPEQAGHYSVIVGFNKNKILLADPHFGKIVKRDISWFEERWFDLPFTYLTKREIIVIRR
jgi:ABC-type bacteriocin/lantibiotic exporter with double-glycine peptidase domain